MAIAVSRTILFLNVRVNNPFFRNDLERRLVINAAAGRVWPTAISRIRKRAAGLSNLKDHKLASNHIKIL